DRDAKYTKHITLSYTFYEIDLPEQTQAALDLGALGTDTENDAKASDNERLN
ncbi:cytochrome C oxidase assembly protein, partial [Rhodobacteraceae bacterium PD-2]